MSLRLIYGKAGSGKTSFCFKEIKENINKKEKIYIITPDQFSFTAEKHLLDILEEKAVINAEVLTFSRMAYRVFQEVGGSTQIPLSNSSVSMLIYDTLDKQKEKLTFLGKNSKNIEVVNRLFTELKKHKIENKQIKQIIEETDNKYLSKKLEDILILKEEFEKNIPVDYMLGEDRLNKLVDKLEKSKMFDDCILYLDEFAGFTKQEYAIIEILLKKVKQVNITICTDKLEENQNMETDLFYANKQTALKLIEIAKNSNTQIEKPIKLDRGYRFKNQELEHLEQNIYRTSIEKYKQNVENIELFLTMNPYSEIENLAKQIIFLVREKNYRFKDIAIITKDIENYRSITKAIFEQYEIPIFIDQKRDLSKNILVQFLLSIFDIFSKNWSYESIFTYLKTGLINIEEEDIYNLENYCLQWGIKGKKWYIDDWNYGNLDKEQLEYINDLRKRVAQPLLELKGNISSEKTVKQITSKLYNFLKDYDIFEKLNNKAKELYDMQEYEIANEYQTSMKIIIDLFDEMVNIFGERKVSFDKYRELLKTGLENKDLGVIPGVQDEVIMGDVDRSRSHKIKVVFILGLNDGIFPSNNKQEGFLDDKDRIYLKGKNIELAKNSIEMLYDERFNIYKALTIAEEKLYLSYTSTDKEGKSIRPSVLITNIKRIFPKLTQKSDMVENKKEITLENPTFNDLLEKMYDKKQGKQIDKIWYEVYNYFNNLEEWKQKLINAEKGINYTNIPEKIDQEQIKKLYGNTLKTSISRLEQYRKCPFSFHLKYGLKLKDEIRQEVRAIDTGTFMHEVIDAFFDKIKEEEIELEKLNKDQLESIVSDIVDKKLEISTHFKLSSNAKYRTLTRKLKKIILKSMEYIVEQLVNSKFKVLGTEIEFKNKGDYPPIIIDLEDNKKIEITGKIDRVDLSMGEDGKYIRIIDYKSSAKKIDLNEVVYGLQIQLITYLNEMCNINDYKVAGILYFNLIDYLISSNKRLSEYEIEQELKKNYKMQGLLVEDVKIVKMMDTNLEKGFSETVPVYIDKDGEISHGRSSTMKKEDFEILQKQVVKTIKEISNEILQGDISLKPYYDKNKKTPCSYCTYRSICNFNTKNKDNKYYYIPNLTKDEVIYKLKEGDKNV